MKKTILDGNRLIAEFMGYKNESKYGYWMTRGHYTKYYQPDELEYHISWDWLMPVVEKIEKLGFHTNITYYVGDQRCIISEGTPQGDGGKYTNYIADTEKDPNPDDKITTVWLSVIQFILWYNTNNPKKKEG